MGLEEDIVAWSEDRPAWQRDVMRRTAAGIAISEEDYDELVEIVLRAPGLVSGPTFGLEHLPKTSAQDPPVRIVSISRAKHVNALSSGEPLTFEPIGLTIVYGDNGSGKSGYARLLKHITRARNKEEILSDVFRESALDMPTAELEVIVGEEKTSRSWPDSSALELQRMLFYDSACGNAYVAMESDFPYRPSALAVMDGLIGACVAVRDRIDVKLAENAQASLAIPVVGEGLESTEVGRYLKHISASSSIESLDALIATLDFASEKIDELKKEEAHLRNADTSKERQQLIRQAEKLESLCKHVEALHSMLGNKSLSSLRLLCDQLASVQIAAALLARSFESEPLSGVGTSPWKILWESARRYSEEHAFPVQVFPVVEADCRCVLCQEPLSADGRERLARFESFVKDDTQVRLDNARRLHDKQVQSISGLRVETDTVSNDQKDLEVTHAPLMADLRKLLGVYSDVRKATLDAVASSGLFAPYGIEPVGLLAAMQKAAKAAREMAVGLANPTIIHQRLAATTVRRQELELLHEAKKSRATIVSEINRRNERQELEAAKAAAATGPITKKVLELSEAGITEVVRDTFTREADRLRLERVTIARTRAPKGTLLHQPKLVGARQETKLPRVFSEGERTALGLAGFFTEAHLDGSKSALIFDDPVTSLDHIRRGLVAARLAELAQRHQVIMFTHDVAFVADLKREASARGVPVAERSVTRSREEERKPGACTTKHPWKAKDVAARLDDLRQQLSRIRKESSAWDERQYEEAAAVWAGNLSETWERIFSQEVVGPVLAEGGLEVRPLMVKVLARFSNDDYREFEASYSRVSQWAKRHDKSTLVNFVAPDAAALEAELSLVDIWFKRVKGYKA